MVLFIMLYKVVLTFKSVNKTLECNPSKKSYLEIHSWCGVVYYVLKHVITSPAFCGRNPKV